MSNVRFAFILALLISVGVAAWPVVTQKSEYRGVTVAVTAGNLEPDNGIWDFALAFDSRGPRLDDEVMENVVLVGDGRTMKPLAWEGAGPGGSHRAGVIKFIAMKPRPKQLEMRITRAGEPKPRVFRFVFGDWAA
jgi:hypothetical protein